MAKLTFVLEDGQEVVVPLKEHIIIGRDEDNDIVVDDERISPRHAEIVQNADGSLQVFDLKSSAGTFVNGERQLSCTLLHGDTIAFGPLVGTLDLEHPATSPSVVDTPVAPAVSKPAPPAPVPEPEAPTPEAPEPAPPSPPPPPASPDKALVEAVAHLEAEKARLKSEVAAAEKELRDWQQRAEKERALHLARVESLRAEEEKLAPAKAAIQQAEAAHREWLETISSLTSQHADKTAALERLNAQHYEKATEVQRLTANAAEAQQQIENLTIQKEEADARLKQVRDECEQDEALLNSLRQQIIEHERRIVEEEAKHAALSTASLALSAKHQRDEAAVKDLESLLTSLEQKGAASEGSLQRMQEDLASCEKKLASRTAELTACTTALAAETSRLEEASSKRVELEQLNLDLAATKQQLVDARQRLAAVEQRYRDAQSNSAQGGSQIAPPRRHSAQEPPPDAAVSTNGQHAELPGQIEAARREMAELQARIASLRHSPAGAEGESAQNSSSFPPPVIVQVETIKLAPIPIKSERTRGPGTKNAAAR
ncbi:FHA domain-containing protein [Prosthecobacter sp.]|uniref:FHA domain-containing protein n=1 Tax=Prosthecobacter sp. TaxID=1965333 RepID=UPI0037841FA2